MFYLAVITAMALHLRGQTLHIITNIFIHSLPWAVNNIKTTNLQICCTLVLTFQCQNEMQWSDLITRVNPFINSHIWTTNSIFCVGWINCRIQKYVHLWVFYSSTSGQVVMFPWYKNLTQGEKGTLFMLAPLLRSLYGHFMTTETVHNIRRESPLFFLCGGGNN
jgi:hypothetical protein